MDRFVAMIWDHADPSRQRQVSVWSEALQRRSARWTVVLDAPGLRVLSLIQRGEAPIVTIWQGEDGVVVGPLFERGHERRGRVRSLEQRDARRVVATSGDSLIKDYWGNYIALWSNREHRSAHVLRDPCGAVPCFKTQLNGVELLFAHADDVARLPGLQFTINWTNLQAFILCDYFVTKYTGLQEVTELLGGERLDWSPNRENHLSFLWNGADLAGTPILQNFDNAKADLRAIVDACFTAWGTEYKRIVVSVSGGLDSSILVNLLRRCSNSEIFGLHYVGTDYEQYEVQLARLAARHAGVDLIEVSVDPLICDARGILDIPCLARPALQTVTAQADQATIEVGEKCGADSFMVGHGGDNLFVQRGGAKHMFTDYLLLRGISANLWRVAYDVATLRRCSVFEILGDAFWVVFHAGKWRPFEGLYNEKLQKHCPLGAGIASAIPTAYKHHPWLSQAVGLPGGKANHLSNIVALYNYYVVRGHGLARDAILPYFSQPIAEFALRTATYMFSQGGIDRSLERSAFGDVIPEAIRRRTTKGGADMYVLQIIQRNIAFFRELILEGELATQNWIDREKVERMLNLDHVVHGGGGLFIFRLVAVAAWLNSWREGKARAAAA